MNGDTTRSIRQRFIAQTEAGVTAGLGKTSAEVAVERDELIASLWEEANRRRGRASNFGNQGRRPERA